MVGTPPFFRGLGRWTESYTPRKVDFHQGKPCKDASLELGKGLTRPLFRHAPGESHGEKFDSTSIPKRSRKIAWWLGGASRRLCHSSTFVCMVVDCGKVTGGRSLLFLPPQDSLLSLPPQDSLLFLPGLETTLAGEEMQGILLGVHPPPIIPRISPLPCPTPVTAVCPVLFLLYRGGTPRNP